MRSKLKFVVPLVVLLVAAAAYKFVLAKPSAEAKPKVAGEVYVLPKEFLLNLADGRFAKLGIALVLAPGAKAEPTGGAEGATAPPEGYGALPQEALVRDIVTNSVTDVSGRELISRSGRRRLKREILRELRRQTDVQADGVLFTDVAVQ